MTSKFKELNQIANILKICSEGERKELELRMTPVLLCWFANISDVHSIRDLIQLGVDLNVKDSYNGNRTALHLAASTGNHYMLRLLLDNKAELAMDERRETAF